MRALAARRKCVREEKLTDEPRTFLQMQSEANRLAGSYAWAMASYAFTHMRSSQVEQGSESPYIRRDPLQSLRA